MSCAFLLLPLPLPSAHKVQTEPSFPCYLPGGVTASDLFSLMPFCLSSVSPFNFFLSSALSSLLVRDLITFLHLLFQCAEERQWSSPPLPLWLLLFSYFPVISPSPCALNVPLTHGCLSWDLCATSGYLPLDLSSTCGKGSFFNASISSYLTHI